MVIMRALLTSPCHGEGKSMSLITDLPAIFDQFSEARQKGFLTVMDLKEQGIPLVEPIAPSGDPDGGGCGGGLAVLNVG